MKYLSLIIFTFLSLNLFSQSEAKIVQEMPRFPGCENNGDDIKDQNKCSEEKLLQFVYNNLKYPNAARKKGMEGTTIIQFVIDEEGYLTEITAKSDLGYGLEEAAIKVVESMNQMKNRWTPGKSHGEKIPVTYTLPVRFKL